MIILQVYFVTDGCLSFDYHHQFFQNLPSSSTLVHMSFCFVTAFLFQTNMWDLKGCVLLISTGLCYPKIYIS